MMILYLEYGEDSTTYETQKIHIDLVSSDISCQEFDPGFFENPAQPYTQAVAKLSLHGKPAFTHAISIIGRLQVQVQTSVGRNFGPRVYLWYSPTDDQNLYRAHVTAISFQPEGSASYFNKPDRHLPATMIITHGIWQGALTQIPLTNVHATSTLTPLQIENTKDTLGRDNTAFIDGADITGDLPAPIRLQIVNTHATVHVYQYWIGLNVNSTPGAFVHIAEGEAATPLTNIVTADGSNGASNSITVSNTTDTDMLTWTFDSTFTTRAAGNQFHVFIRNHYSKNFSNNIYWRFRIKDPLSAGTLWRGEQVFFPGAGAYLNIGDYGVIRLPPWRVDRMMFAPAGIKLILSAAQITAAAAITEYIDSILMFPVDGFREIHFNDYLDTNEYCVDDMIENFAYTFPVAGGSLGAVNTLGNPLMLHPGRDQKLYFLSSTGGFGDSAEVTSTVQIWYRPLKLAL